MQIIKTFTSYEGHRIICPSTGEIIWEPNFEEYNTEAVALKGMWFSDALEEPEINDPELQKDWFAFFQKWERDSERESMDIALERFFQHYHKPEWVVYLCEYYRTASCYYVVLADTIIEEDPVYGPEYRDKHNYIKNAQLSFIHFPEGTTSVKDGACYSYHELEDVHMPETVTSIGKSAFMFCSKLKQIKLPNTITHIGEAAFRECTALEHIDLPNALRTIPDEMFFNCKNLRTIHIPDSVETLGDKAFKGCVALEEVLIPRKQKNSIASAFDESTLPKLIYY